MSEHFGTLPDGRPVSRHTLRAGTGGVVLRVLDHGATVQSLVVPDPDGTGVEVVLGFAAVQDYVAAADDCFGGVAGRFANRIRGGDLEVDGKRYRLSTNDHGHTLHGGVDGFHRRLWDVDEADRSRIRLSLTSPDGDQGFPGRLHVTVTYAVTEREVRIDYSAETDAPTVVNLTNHAYFNLAGAGSGSVEGHELTIDADAYTVTGPDQIPTGELAAVDGTPLDFRSPHLLGERLRSNHPQLRLARGYDHNFVVRGDGLRGVAALRDPGSGRTLEVLSDQPGLQLYTANFLDGRHVGASGTTYRQGDGVALETQHFPNSPQHPAFPSTELRPGETFTSTTVWRFSHDSRPASGD